MELSVLSAQVEQIVRQADDSFHQAFTTTQKDSPSNIVTTADLAVQAFLERELCTLLPGSAFFGEEGTAGSLSAEYLWIVDPIDGTANFSRGIGECGISVALLCRQTLLLGVVYNPFQDKLYSAVRDGGAWCNGRPIRVSGKSFREGLLCTALSLYRKEYAQQCMAVIGEAYAQCNDIRRFGSCALELCYLAEGKCDLYFEFRVFPWDCAAAHLILEEAGGVIRGQNGQKVTFDRATPIIAANTQENFDRLNAIVQKHIPQFPYKEILR